MVVMTHLHRDHVGWNLLAQGSKFVPTFPNARYWMSTKDWEACHQPDVQRERFPNAPSCVWPLEALGLIEFMNGEHSITRELTAVPDFRPPFPLVCARCRSRSTMSLVSPDSSIQVREWISW